MMGKSIYTHQENHSSAEPAAIMSSQLRLLHHPPAVTFCVCAITLAAALLSLSAYLKTHPATDSDLTQDWESLLHVLSRKKLCRVREVGGDRSSPALNPEESTNVSIPAAISLSPWPAALAYSSLRITTTGAQLGLAGLDADTPLSVSLTSGPPAPRCNSTHADCFLTYCIQITGPRHLLPQSRSPPLCPVSNPSTPVLSDLYVVETEASNSSSCYSLAYIAEPYLKNVLTEAEVALCVQRLNYTGLTVLLVGLLLIVLSACCFPPSKETTAHGPL